MNPNKRKSEWLETAPTEVLMKINASHTTLAGPLGTMVHIEGIGQIKVSAIKSELALRKELSNAGDAG